jgi:hypothetical protein
MVILVQISAKLVHPKYNADKSPSDPKRVNIARKSFKVSPTFLKLDHDWRIGKYFKKVIGKGKIN